ncbi:hypothetical protein, partial [Pseudovibrio sp. Ad26]|uniref:hypothetical protein n=1 Tax=Pseudovibrio sp. Ad26 TaxID=989410 RepID=UPI000A87D455
QTLLEVSLLNTLSKASRSLPECHVNVSTISPNTCHLCLRYVHYGRGDITDPIEKFVLITTANFADEYGLC